jgi:hypothetical protein
MTFVTEHEISREHDISHRTGHKSQNITLVTGHDISHRT